jgi:Na+/proline symporter
MSNVALSSDLFSWGALIVGSPGIVVGGLVGALAWRGHRGWGAAIGAVLGLALWLFGWLYFGDVVVR